MHISECNGFCMTLIATTKQYTIKNPYNPNTNTLPTSPNSSAKEANMKSV